MKNLPASIQARLKNYAKENRIDFTVISRLYMQEGVLHRIAVSKFRDSFILKGGLLLYSLSGFKSRPTKDIDLLGSDIPRDESTLTDSIKEILSIIIEDGLKFQHDDL